MRSIPFGTEIFFAEYEFSTPYLLSVSDCESLSIAELLDLAGLDMSVMENLRLGYTESQGDLELRQLIAANIEQIGADEVIILGSPIEGIFLVMQALLDPRDEVIVLTPAYDALINIPVQRETILHRWSMLATNDGWHLDLDSLRRLVNERTKVIVVNFPHNPTGYLPTIEQFSELIEIAAKHGTWLFCDEMYRGLEMEQNARLPSAVNLYDRSIVLSGLSKTHGLPGLRAGWLITQSRRLRDQLMNWKFYTSICPAAPTEFLAKAALMTDDSIVARNREIIRTNIKLASDFFVKWAGFFSWYPPQAGSVALVGVDVDSSTDYCHRLVREAGVLLLPSIFLGFDDHHVRFGFGRKSFPDALAQYDRHLMENNIL